MKFDEIMQALRNGKCYSTAGSLEVAITDEMAALAKLPTYQLRDAGKKAREDARSFYADDITNQLNDPEQPTPDRMLSHRRFPVAWAVAEVMRTNNLIPGPPVSASKLLHNLEYAMRMLNGDPSDPAMRGTVEEALKVYEASGDHDHGGGPIAAGQKCLGGNCAVHQARELLKPSITKAGGGYDYDKLARDLVDAKVKAIAAVRGVADGGTCNFDSCTLRIPKALAAKVLAAGEKGGLRLSKWHDGSFHVSNPVCAQGTVNTIQAETIEKHMSAAGWHTGVYYQMD